FSSLSMHDMECTNQSRIKWFPLWLTWCGHSAVRFGILFAGAQVPPPLVERWTSTPPPLQLIPSSAWYWKPCPGPLVLSMVNHSLSPPPPPLSPESNVQVWPPFSERHKSSQKKDWAWSDWRLR